VTIKRPSMHKSSCWRWAVGLRKMKMVTRMVRCNVLVVRRAARRPTDHNFQAADVTAPWVTEGLTVRDTALPTSSRIPEREPYQVVGHPREGTTPDGTGVPKQPKDRGARESSSERPCESSASCQRWCFFVVISERTVAMDLALTGPSKGQRGDVRRFDARVLSSHQIKHGNIFPHSILVPKCVPHH
jgi:hypothetical protein